VTAPATPSNKAGKPMNFLIVNIVIKLLFCS
jgi:hypothetical protein